MKEFTQEQNLMHVNNVGKPSIGLVALDHMKKFIVVRKPMYASNREKLLLFLGT
jgi:hypothetical protein